MTDREEYLWALLEAWIALLAVVLRDGRRNVRVEWCPTSAVLRDYDAPPLGGAERERILG